LTLNGAQMGHRMQSELAATLNEHVSTEWCVGEEKTQKDLLRPFDATYDDAQKKHAGLEMKVTGTANETFMGNKSCKEGGAKKKDRDGYHLLVSYSRKEGELRVTHIFYGVITDADYYPTTSPNGNGAPLRPACRKQLLVMYDATSSSTWTLFQRTATLDERVIALERTVERLINELAECNGVE